MARGSRLQRPKDYRHRKWLNGRDSDPLLAKRASHVTILQHSPSSIVARSVVDHFALWAQNYLPDWLAHCVTRSKVLVLGFLFFSSSA